MTTESKAFLSKAWSTFQECTILLLDDPKCATYLLDTDQEGLDFCTFDPSKNQIEKPVRILIGEDEAHKIKSIHGCARVELMKEVSLSWNWRKKESKSTG